MFAFSVFDSKYPFLGASKFGPKSQNKKSVSAEI